MSDKTARNVWGTVKRMMRDAAHAKPSTGLRCLESNTLRDVMAPERSRARKALQFLYPSEFLAFVSCPDVPRRWKRNVVIAVFLGLRDGEQRALRWEHVDLEHGIVNVCETFDQARPAKLAAKVRNRGPLAPCRSPPHCCRYSPRCATRRTAKGSCARASTANAPWPAGFARGSRSQTSRAPHFHERTSVSLPIRWHDLRATCGTWLAVDHRSATEIRDVLGHTQVSMTDKYLRNATAVRGGAFGEPFPALPEFRHSSDIDETSAPNIPKLQGDLRGGRDSNPRPPA
jgi:integrase